MNNLFVHARQAWFRAGKCSTFEISLHPQVYLAKAFLTFFLSLSLNMSPLEMEAEVGAFRHSQFPVRLEAVYTFDFAFELLYDSV
jgi:hypothetical protein